MSRRVILLLLVLGLWLLPGGQGSYLDAALPLAKPNADVMRKALHHALNLQFDQAITLATQLEEENQPTLASHLTRGMIAYFQVRWQTRQSPPAYDVGHKALSALLDEGQEQLTPSHEAPWLRLLLGTAAIFDALLQQPEAPLQSMSLFAQGRDWLQQVLIAHDEVTDAHLGLGLLYFDGSKASSSLLRMLARPGDIPGTEQSVHHLKRAAEAGHFSPDVARTFLARLYETEQRYEEAIALGQQLQTHFPNNGYYALLTGRSQCAHAQHEACAATLGALASRVAASPAALAQRADRFDLYYTWGKAWNELRQYDPAFTAFRQAINQDPRAVKDDTLWAKYQVARIYERRGQRKTARQLYQTLLRRRNVDDLHERVSRRLAALR